MDVSDIPLFALADKRLAWLDQRVTLVSSNVANASTPNFRSRDLVPFEQVLAGASVKLANARTNPKHQGGTIQADMAPVLPAESERSPDGNAVSIETEMMHLSQTDAAQELVGELVHKYMGMFKTAAGR